MKIASEVDLTKISLVCHQWKNSNWQNDTCTSSWNEETKEVTCTCSELAYTVVKEDVAGLMTNETTEENDEKDDGTTDDKNDGTEDNCSNKNDTDGSCIDEDDKNGNNTTPDKDDDDKETITEKVKGSFKMTGFLKDEEHKKQCVTDMTTFLREKFDCTNCIGNVACKNGSIKVEFVVNVVKGTKMTDIEEDMDTLEKEITAGGYELTIGGEKFPVDKDSFSKTVVTNTAESSSSNVALIVGCVVGAVIVLAIIIAVLVYCLKCKKSKVSPSEENRAQRRDVKHVRKEKRKDGQGSNGNGQERV